MNVKILSILVIFSVMVISASVSASCGDGWCDPKMGEDFATCPGDCPMPNCGDLMCDPWMGENIVTCPMDCLAECGNGWCQPEIGETLVTCPVDCAAECGNGWCQPEIGEDFATCPADCTMPNCGDGWCDPMMGENNNTCPADCPTESDYFVYSELDTGMNWSGSYGVDGYVGDDGIDRIIFYNCDWMTMECTAYIYTVTIPVGDDPNMHPDNPDATGPIAPRTFTLERTFSLHSDSYGHDNEFYVGQDGFYLGAAWGAEGIEHYDWDGTYLGKVVDVAAPGWPQSLAFDGVDTWYAGEGSCIDWTPDCVRAVYRWNIVSMVWEESFRYTGPLLDWSHHDGMEYVNGKLYLADYTGEYILQFDPSGSGLVEPENIFYHEPLTHELEGMGYGALTHFWVGSHGSTITEFGGGALQVEECTPVTGNPEIDDACCCEDFTNHGAYVSCVAHKVNELGIKGKEGGEIKSNAGRSLCGMPPMSQKPGKGKNK